jgi:uncharacterized delta-60 repeat protein
MRKVLRAATGWVMLLGLAAALVLPGYSSSLVTTSWLALYNGTGGEDVGHAMAVDAEGYVHVAGYSWGVANDLIVTKYAEETGAVKWSARYNGPANGNDGAQNTLALGPNGSVYVTGTSDGVGTGRDFITIKYDRNGKEEWARRYDGPGSGWDFGRRIVVTPDGCAYVTGDSTGANGDTDYATLKYSPDGTLLWCRRYDGEGGSADVALGLALRPGGGVVVTGNSTGAAHNLDFVTISYGADGTRNWVAPYDGSGHGADTGDAVAVDDFGCVYVTGRSRGLTTGDDYATVKYSAAGALVWEARYEGAGADDPQGLALTADGVYVTGASETAPGNLDYYTVKYHLDGTRAWARWYNGPGNGEDVAQALALGTDGSVYVTGHATGVASGADYATLKYTPEGTQAWVVCYEGDGNGFDEALGVAVDPEHAVSVTGYAAGVGTGSSDAATIRYEQPADAVNPTLVPLAAGISGASNGLAFVPVKVTDSGSGVAKVQLTAGSTNCHLEYPLGTRLVPAGTSRPHTLILPNAQSSVTVYVVKDSNASARVEVRAWDAAGNTAVLDPVVANLKIKQGRRIVRTFTGIPEAERYIALQNGTPGLAAATLWVNGRVVFRGELADGQVVSLDAGAQMRPGRRNTVRIVARGEQGATALLTIGDAAAESSAVAVAGRALGFEFVR